ncbi:MAG: HD domain-containing protein [Candidatus Pacebacteria bacterium]|nr:HD domain-containing protein [Candidatus Paceibacterota bacterium]
MDDIINFFSEIGKLKGMPRKGWVIRNIKNPESIAEHTFRVAIMAWILGERKKTNLNIEKLLKMALIHDLCEVYAGDTTPYNSLLPKDKKKQVELTKSWPRFSEEEKKRLMKEKYNREKKGLEKLVKNLPARLKEEIRNLWFDYEKGLSPEGRFFRQTDRIESFMQAVEYWKRYKKPAQRPWWLQAKELIDDPVLIEFIDGIDKSFYKNKKPKN